MDLIIVCLHIWSRLSKDFVIVPAVFAYEPRVLLWVAGAQTVKLKFLSLSRQIAFRLDLHIRGVCKQKNTDSV